MDPLKFPQANRRLIAPKGMEDCDDLHALAYNSGGGDLCFVSLWRPTWRERLSMLFFGKVWLGMIANFGHPPVWVRGVKSIFKED
jgi:hypothetical protein